MLQSTGLLATLLKLVRLLSYNKLFPYEPPIFTVEDVKIQSENNALLRFKCSKYSALFLMLQSGMLLLGALQLLRQLLYSSQSIDDKFVKVFFMLVYATETVHLYFYSKNLNNLTCFLNRLLSFEAKFVQITEEVKQAGMFPLANSCLIIFCMSYVGFCRNFILEQQQNSKPYQSVIHNDCSRFYTRCIHGTNSNSVYIITPLEPSTCF